MTMPTAIITAVRVELPDGRVAAQIDRIDIGGGSQIVTVDGIPEERIHPATTTYHVRLVSPDRMLPDELRETHTYDEAIQLGVRYASLLQANAQRIADLANDLRV